MSIENLVHLKFCVYFRFLAVSEAEWIRSVFSLRMQWVRYGFNFLFILLCFVLKEKAVRVTFLFLAVFRYNFRIDFSASFFKFNLTTKLTKKLIKNFESTSHIFACLKAGRVIV